MNHPALSSFIWSVADLLRGDYKQSEYGKVILPFTVLRRLDCVLEATKAAVLAEKPRVLAIGEAHAQKGSGVDSSAKRFTLELLPALKGKASDLLVELMLPAKGCAKKVEAVREKQKVVTEKQAETDQNEYVTMGQEAKKLGIVLVASLFERRAAGLYHNTAVVFEKDGRMLGKYRKMHIPDDPGFYEKFYFTPGDLGFEPIQTSVGKLGVLVCWDQWYPEAARLMALAGAELLLYPTAIGSEPHDPSLDTAAPWRRAMQGHAVSNVIPVVGANRTGFEPWAGYPNGGQQFYGSSFIADHLDWHARRLV